MKELENFRNFLKEEDNNSFFIYKKDSGGGKPTMILKLKPEGWEKVKHLFDSEGRPSSSEIKRIPSSGMVWNLYASNIGGLYKIYGVSGDWTFGNAPTFYQQKYRGNIRAAKKIFDIFIEKYLK